MKPIVSIYEKRLHDLTKTEREILTNLTISEDSHMAYVLKENPSKTMSWIAQIKDKNTKLKTIIAWSLMRWYSPDIRSVNCSYISLFVNPLFRRQGIGKQLIQRTIEYSQKNQYTPIVYGKTKLQFSFYKACGIDPAQITQKAFPKQYWEHYRFVKQYLNSK